MSAGYAFTWRSVSVLIREVARRYTKATEQEESLLEGKELSTTMSNQAETTNPLDPFDTVNIMREASLKTWNSMRDASLESWSKMMIDMVNSEDYSQATGQWLDSYLTLSQPYKRMIDMMMTQVLTGLNMPMRTDVTSLAERLTNIETRLDDQDAKLDDILSAIKAVAVSNPATDTSSKAKGAS